MILRYKLYSMAGATALLSSGPRGSDAFNVHQSTIRTRSTSTSTSHLHSNLAPDWNNDDFLSSLDKGTNAMEEANDKYYEQANNRAAMDNWRAEKAVQAQQEEQSRQAVPPPQNGPGPSPELLQSMQGQPQWETEPPPTPQQQQPAQFYDANGNPVVMPMVYDANGNPIPFNPAAMQQPPAAQPPQPPAPLTPNFEPNLPNALEPPLPTRTKGADEPRPVGYNTDAYAVSNTADVYFAQLKQDSKVRKMARLSGDSETANKVFGDDSIREIKDSWNENPYTKEKNYAEARSEIEGTVIMQVMGDKSDQPVGSSGVSYRDRLAQAQAKKAGGGAGAVAASPVASQPAAPEPKAIEPPKKVPVPSLQKLLQSPPPPPSAEPQPMATTAAASAPMDDGEVRGKIRTAQGLLLKHRGGPGFGAGRLGAPEAKRLEDTMDDVTGILRSEIGGVGSSPTAVAPQPVVADTTPPPLAPPVAVTPPHPMPPVPATPTPAQAATMVSSAHQASMPMDDPLAGSVMCVEAVLNMYQNAPPGEREALMVPLREALMAAGASANKYIAETELEAHKAAMDAGPAAAMGADAPSMEGVQPTMGFPTTYEGAKPIASTGGDEVENDNKLEEAYAALMNARGDGGKLGLKNVSGDEARELADKLVAMRSVLLDELNSGS